MPNPDPIDIDRKSAPFDQLSGIRRLGTSRTGRESAEHARHHLYTGRDRRSRAQVLVKITAKPGLVYEHDLINETENLAIINRELPGSRYFPVLLDRGRLGDGRIYLTTYLFDELPLATAIGDERMPARTVAHLRTAIEIAKALAELHGLEIVHADLNPMNILRREEGGRPVIRIVDFESSYATARHADGTFYNPPTTAGYTAPELSQQPPDAQADIYSLGAVLYTMLAGYEWTLHGPVTPSVASDEVLDPALRKIVLTAVDPNPGRRQSSAEDLRAELSAHLERIWPGRSW
jgi:serine/threonine protein kinase